MNRGLSAEQLGGLLDERHLATLATVRTDGSILLSPIWYIWEDGGFTLGMAAGDGKLKHIEREPRVTIVVADEAFPYRGFELRGIARLLDVPYGPDDPADREPLRRRGRVRLLRRRAGRHGRAGRARRDPRLGLRRRPRRHGRAVARDRVRRRRRGVPGRDVPARPGLRDGHRRARATTRAGRT